MRSFAPIALLAVLSCSHSFAQADSVPFERLNKSDAALLIVDMQVGLFAAVRDFDVYQFSNALIAHSELGNLFQLPTIMTTSTETGPNGPLLKEITDGHPNITVIRRPGEVNAWDNPEFRAAVEATGKKQLIIAGIVTDVCTTFLALSLRAEGYSVWANADASGTVDLRTAQDANDRIRNAGVHVVSLFSIVADLFRDWRNTNPGAAELVTYLNKYSPSIGFVARVHAAAISNGSLIPGEAEII